MEKSNKGPEPHDPQVFENVFNGELGVTTGDNSVLFLFDENGRFLGTEGVTDSQDLTDPKYKEIKPKTK